MTEAAHELAAKNSTVPVGRAIVVLAVWFGVTTGLGEGIGLLAFQKLGWLNWGMAELGVSVGIIWISATFNLLLGLFAGLFLWIASRFFPRLDWLRVGVFLFSWFLFLDWVALSGRIHDRGALVFALGLATVTVRWFGKRRSVALAFWRRTTPWVLATAILAFVAIEGGGRWLEHLAITSLRPARPGAPNILIVVVDTLRADHLSSYGYSRPTSPNIDRLAREGVLFENAIAPSSWTLPSHASLLTGKYPFEHGATALTNKFDGRSRTLGEVLQQKGYRTAAFSANRIFFTRAQGFGKGFVHFEDFFYSVPDMVSRTVSWRKLAYYVFRRFWDLRQPPPKTATQINRAAVQWIDRDPDRPFFVLLNYLDTHSPPPPQPFRRMFSDIPSPGGRLAHAVEVEGKISPEELQHEIEVYDGAVAYVDHEIGELLKELERRHLSENTIVVITSDHGESFGEHRLYMHRVSLYWPEIHVPLIFRWPEKVPSGPRIDVPVSLTGIPATLLQLAEVPADSLSTAPSLVELWTRMDVTDWPLPLSELQVIPAEPQNTPVRYGWMKSLVSGKFHYIVHEKLGDEVYAWRDDPKEQNNLARTPEGRAIAAAFADRLRKFLSKPNERSQEQIEGTRSAP